MARRKYPVPKRVKFDTKLIKEVFEYGETKFALTDKDIRMYSRLSDDWGILYSGRYNDLSKRWVSLCTL